jgi:hypothetical protein
VHRLSVVCQTESSIALGMTGPIYMASLLREIWRRGISAHLDLLDSYGSAWVAAYGGVDVMSSAGYEHEVVVRNFAPGSWPARLPQGVHIDLAVDEANSSGEADYVLSLIGPPAGGAEAFGGAVTPLPPELRNTLRTAVPGKVGVCLDLDPDGRLVSLVAALTGGAITSAEGISLRADLTGTNVFYSPLFWERYATCDVLVTSGMAPALVAGAMGIPVLAVANNALQETRLLAGIAAGRRYYNYLGLLTSLTNAQIADHVRNMLDYNPIPTPSSSIANRQTAQWARMAAMHASGLHDVTTSGSFRVAEWIQQRFILGRPARPGPTPIFVDRLP